MFRERVDSNPELQAKFGDAWGRLEELAAVKTRFEPRRRFHSTAGSARLSRALAVVRACRAADAEEKDRLAKQVRSMPDISGSRMDGFQRASFLDHLTRAARWLPDNDPFRQAVIADRTAEEFRHASPHQQGKETDSRSGIPTCTGLPPGAKLRDSAYSTSSCASGTRSSRRHLLSLVAKSTRTVKTLTSFNAMISDRRLLLMTIL